MEVASLPMCSPQGLSSGWRYFVRHAEHPLQMLAWTWMYPGHSHMLERSLEEDLSSWGKKEENHEAKI